MKLISERIQFAPIIVETIKILSTSEFSKYIRVEYNPNFLDVKDGINQENTDISLFMQIINEFVSLLDDVPTSEAYTILKVLEENIANNRLNKLKDLVNTEKRNRQYKRNQEIADRVPLHRY